MSAVVISGNTSGSVTLDAPAVAGSTTYTLAAVSGTIAPLVSGTAQNSTSGTSIDFTGIPSWAKRITVMFNGVSTSGSSIVQVQIGSGSIDATATYLGSVTGTAGATTGSTLNSTGFLQDTASASTYIRHGSLTLTNISGNIWSLSGTTSNSDAVRASSLSGSKTLSGTLDRIRITTVNGTDTFDAGSINIMYE